MLIRHALWKMRLEAGDGTATMAVLYQAVLREGIRYVAQFGCSAMLLREFGERITRRVGSASTGRHSPVSKPSRIGRGMCQGEMKMAWILREMLDRVGPDGLIVIEGAKKLGLEREYIEGTYWKLSGWLSRLFVTDMAKRSRVFEDAALLISDFDMQEPQHLLPVLENCIRAGIKKLVILAKDMSERASDCWSTITTPTRFRRWPCARPKSARWIVWRPSKTLP